MIFNVDVSKVLPERKSYVYLIAFIPGLFFELSIYLANAPVAYRLAAQANQAVGLSKSTIVVSVLLLAFIIGNGFMFIPSLIQYYSRYIYKVWWFCWKQFCRWPFKPFVDWLCRKPRLIRMTEIQNLNRYVHDLGFSIQPEEANNVWRCWNTLARRLLSIRYGIEPKDVRARDWSVLYGMLGTREAEDVRGSLLMFTLEATGWSGIAATRIAPALHTKHFYYFCLFLIVNGLIHDFFVVRRTTDPRAFGYINIRAVLRELQQLPKQETPPTKGSDQLAE